MHRLVTLIARYVWNKHWNSNASLPLFCTCKPHSSLPLPSVTEYTRPNSNGHFAFVASSNMPLLNPKSSLTLSSALRSVLSVELLPRNSQ